MGPPSTIFPAFIAFPKNSAIQKKSTTSINIILKGILGLSAVFVKYVNEWQEWICVYNNANIGSI